MQKYLLIAFWPFQSAKMSGSWTSVPSNSSTQETRELLFSNRSLSPALLWWRSGGGSGVLSLCCSCCLGICTQQAACHTGRKLPWCPHASFSLLAPLNHNPPTPHLGVLLESWLHLGPSRLAAISVIGSTADSSSLSPVFCSLPTY